MKCIICNQRKGKRHCPAKNGLICARCCGEKRVIEIQCPQDCPYLSVGLSYQWTKTYSATMDWLEDPVQRRQLFEAVRDCADELALLEIGIVDYSRDVRALTDGDVLEAIETLLKTYHTEEKGVIYEHSTPNPLAQSLARELREAIKEAVEEDTEKKRFGRSSIVAALEALKIQLSFHLDQDAGDKGFLTFLLRSNPQETSSQQGSGIIVSPWS